MELIGKVLLIFLLVFVFGLVWFDYLVVVVVFGERDRKRLG